MRYTIAALIRNDRPEGYVVYRHAHEPRGRVTIVVDFLVDPDDRDGLQTLLRWVDREARAADSDKIRCFCLHDAFGRTLKGEGYSAVKSTLQFVVKVNALSVPPDFYSEPIAGTSCWAIRIRTGDGDPTPAGRHRH